MRDSSCLGPGAEPCYSLRSPQAALDLAGLALESDEESFMRHVRRIGVDRKVTKVVYHLLVAGDILFSCNS